MGLFWQSAEEKEAEQREQEAWMARQAELRRRRLAREEIFDKMIIFPGSKAELEDFLGYKTAWVDLGESVKGLTYRAESMNYRVNPFGDYSIKFQNKIANARIVALVNAVYSVTDCTDYDRFFGMPVRKADQAPK